MLIFEPVNQEPVKVKRGRPKGSGKKQEILPVVLAKRRGRPKSGKKVEPQVANLAEQLFIAQCDIKKYIAEINRLKEELAKAIVYLPAPVMPLLDEPVKRGGRPKGSGKKAVNEDPAIPCWIHEAQVLAQLNQVNEEAVVDVVNEVVNEAADEPPANEEVVADEPLPVEVVNEEAVNEAGWHALVPKRRGRPKKVAAIVEPINAIVPERFVNVDQNGNILSLKNLIAVICAHYPSGIKLDELSKKCCEANYKSNSSGKKFVQNVRTNLNVLIKNGTIVKDAEKKYYLNPYDVNAQF